MRRALAVTLALFGLILALAHVRYAPPAAVARDAAPDRFSAERAREVQTRLVGDGATRNVGTEGNRRGRAVIAAELEKSGWTVESQATFACTFYGVCAPIVNVVARLPGREPASAGVLLSAHHDSVPVSPGASDDGVGVAAVLESARALAAGPRPRRTVVALFTDAEESGLLGADAFVRGHELAAKVRTTVNIDARGSHGPSQMFETSRGNAWLVSLMASHLERPVTTSLYYEIYKRMPNDTDFTVTKTIASGINFANIAGIADYHTPLDAMTTSDIGTLQHHGDHVLGMARALAEDAAAHGAEAGADAVWFDVLALGIVHFPANWSLLIALVSLALVVGHAIRAKVFDRGLFVGLGVIPGVLGALAVGPSLKAVGALPAVWVAHPLPALLAIHGGAAAATLAVMFALAAKSTPRALWAGTWMVWGVLGAVTAAMVPGASYLFIVPTAVAALVGSLSFELACILPASVAALLFFALVPSFYEALGFAVAPALAIPTIFALSTTAPMLAGLSARTRRLPLAIAAATVVAMIGALAVPKFSETSPQRANVVFRQDTGDAKVEARTFVDMTWGASTWGAAPLPMLNALGGKRETAPSLPWNLPSISVESTPLDIKAPTLEEKTVAEVGDKHHVAGRVRSQRGATSLTLLFPGKRHIEIKVEGRYAFTRSTRAGSMLHLLGVPSEGVRIELDADGHDPVSMTLLDRSAGVPPGTRAAEVVAARPKDAVPSQDGDLTVITTPLSM